MSFRLDFTFPSELSYGPLVLVLIPCFNAERRIARALEPARGEWQIRPSAANGDRRHRTHRGPTSHVLCAVPGRTFAPAGQDPW